MNRTRILTTTVYTVAHFYLGDMTRICLAAHDQRRAVVMLPLPGKIAAGYRRGLNTAPQGQYGQITWKDWVNRHSKSA